MNNDPYESLCCHCRKPLEPLIAKMEEGEEACPDCAFAYGFFFGLTMAVLKIVVLGMVITKVFGLRIVFQ